MKSGFELTETSDLELWDIWSNIALDSPEAADRLIERLRIAISRLVEYPHLGHTRNGLSIGIRILGVGRYQIVYRPETDPLQVIPFVGPYQDVDRLASPS